MEKTLSQIILDLYEIRERPLQNIDRLKSIIEKAQSLGIDLPPPQLPKREDIVASRSIENRVSTLNSLYDCVSKYLSSEKKVDERSEITVRKLAEELQSNLHQNLKSYEQQLNCLSIKITKSNKEYFESLISQLISRRLEYELLPNLMKNMGYERLPTTFKIEDKIVEIDGHYESNKYNGAANERLIEKNVIIVECKTTINSRDIDQFHHKIEALRAKYDNDKINWGYDKLNFECWIVGCYGWIQELIEKAEAKGIKVFTPDRFEEMLKKNKVLDRRIPTCPPCK